MKFAAREAPCAGVLRSRHRLAPSPGFGSVRRASRGFATRVVQWKAGDRIWTSTFHLSTYRCRKGSSVPEVTPADAAKKLGEKVRGMDLDDLRDAYNELFPEAPVSQAVVSSNGEA